MEWAQSRRSWDDFYEQLASVEEVVVVVATADNLRNM
jgi:hypothetical protein